MQKAVMVKDIVVNDVPSTKAKQQRNNIYRVNFRATSDDQFVKQNKAVAPIYTQPPMLDTRKQLKQIESAQKNEKRKQNLSWGLGIAASLAIVLMAFPHIKGLFGKGGPKMPGDFSLSNLTFSDLKGDTKIGSIRETKTYTQKVKDFFVDLLDNSNLDEKALTKAGFKGEALPNAALILGPPGVGKTEAVKMFAKELGGEYCEVKLGEVANSFVDGTSTQMLTMFKELTEKAKSNPKKNFTIFFDEIDGFARKLGTINSNNEYLGKNRQSFIKGLDMLAEQKNVRIFGATNVNISEVDDAVISRLQKNITINLPEEEQLLEGLKFHLRNVEGIDSFFEKQKGEIKKFLKGLYDKKSAFRDVASIAKDARSKYSKEITKTKNYDLEFDVKYLIKALEEKGKTAGELATK